MADETPPVVTAAAPEPAPEPAAEPPQPIDDSAPVETPATAEEPAQDDPAEEALPQIDPPRSWTKEQREHWQSLPRTTQEYLHGRETDRDREVRKVQNEAADARKAAEAERATIAQQRAQYEQAIKAALDIQSKGGTSEFADIQSSADAMKLATEDPFRYARFAAHQQQLQVLQQEQAQAQHRQIQEREAQMGEWRAKQDAAFIDRVPEFADTAKREALQKAAVATLSDVGFSQEEMQGLYQNSILRDARIQELILKAAKYDQGQRMLKTAPAKSVPPVMRPGVSQPRPSANAAKIEALNTQLESATGTRAARIASELMQLKRAARR